MSEELQPGQLVIVDGVTCKILECNHKLPSALRYTVETPDAGIMVVAASQITEVITEAPEADDAAAQAQKEADEAAADAAQREADEVISAEAAEQAEKDAAADVAAALEQAHEAGDHAETPVDDCSVCKAEAQAGSPS